jgi:predicted nucleotidyltransferase
VRLSHPFEVITPTVDGDVLAVLGRADGPFSGRQIHRLIGQRSEAGVRKTLDRLVEQGIVLRRKVGGTYLHSLNQDHLAAEAIRSIAHLRETVASFISEVLQAWDHPPAFAALFGSTARGEETAGSDLDILLVRPVHVDEESWQRAVSIFASTVSKATGNDTRVLELTAAELWSPGNEALRKELLRDAVVLLGNRDVLSRRP